MTYYIKDSNQEDQGPFTRKDLEKRFRDGRISLETQVRWDGSSAAVAFRELQELTTDTPPASEGYSDHINKPRPKKSGFLRQFTGLSLFLWPFNQLHRLGDIDNRNLLALTGIGLVPLILLTLFTGLFTDKFVFFLTAFYFSVLWAILFYHIFPAPNIRISTSILCFMGTGLVSISLLVGFFKLPFISLPNSWLGAEIPAIRAVAFFVWVAVPEELCKILMIYVLSKRSEVYLPKTMAYYGMICGLGFGIHEGLEYQLARNALFAESSTEYLLLNLLRLTSLPALHAVWTGIASYFLSFAYLYPSHRLVLILVALTIPSILHALFNTFNGTLTSLGISLLSVLMLVLYLSKHDTFDIFLRREEHLN
ncbi:MAG: hypothetical protein M2R45_04965 [Verrucomicrobia subdivision 3 bacterium]|nr:hypothetical protein [Limisphaerales bacterium]MCS1414088.1 hypothetical protein [Limisphaerales bacterium]